MYRLTFYIARQFLGAIFSIFVLVVFLAWLTQVLSRFTLVTGKGQSVWVFLAQTGYLLPMLANVVLPACVVLGLARALRELDASRELHSIHGVGRVGSIGAAFGLVMAIAVSGLAAGVHFLEPAAAIAAGRLVRAANADVIAQTTVAGVFTEIEDGVTVRIDRRGAEGEMEGFFLYDDRDPEVTQTIYARTATVSRPEAGIDVVLNNGSLQFRDRETGSVSMVSFERYQLGVAELISPSEDFFEPKYLSTPQLLAAGAPTDNPRWISEPHYRFAYPLLAVSLGLMTLAAMGFPRAGSIRQRIPSEVWLVGGAIVVEAAGAAVVRAAQDDPAWIALIYAVTALPALAGLAIAWRRLGWGGAAGRVRRWVSR